MNEAVQIMLSRYACVNTQDYLNAIKEIIQEVALLGLWRAKFYEHAAFYGGTALRVLYGLDRFSEDLDFSLLKPNPSFSLHTYNSAIKAELMSFGFEVEVEEKHKSSKNNIQSAFIKTGTYNQLIKIEPSKKLLSKINGHKMIKIKMEVDIDPPDGFKTEAKYLLMPIPFSVNAYCEPDLLAGKLHAILCRSWQRRVKGRDWYDLVWYISRNTPCRIRHLQARLIQSGHWKQNKKFNLNVLKELLLEKLKSIDIVQAQKDIALFIKDIRKIELWSMPFFTDLIQRITVVD